MKPIKLIFKVIIPTLTLWAMAFSNIVFKQGLVSALKRAKAKLYQLIKGQYIGGYSFRRLTLHRFVADPSVMNSNICISIVVPVYNTPQFILIQALESVMTQNYPNWRLIVVDDGSNLDHIKPYLENLKAQDKRITLHYRTNNGNISASINDGLEYVETEFYGILDHDDTLAPNALYEVAKAILANPDADYFYSDEDKMTKDGAVVYAPFYKPCWSPEYFMTMMYTCHWGIYRTALVKKLGGYKSKFDGAQDFELTLRLIACSNKIKHIPHVLYHWRVWDQSTAGDHNVKPLAFIRAKNALKEYLEGQKENFVLEDGVLPGNHKVIFYPKSNDLISIVIPTANGQIEMEGRTENHLDAVLKSIYEKSTYKNYEVVVVHNGNLNPGQIEYLNTLSNLRLVHYESSVFSLSEKINLGAGHSKGKYLLILNDDIRVITPNWLELMLGVMQREGVGVVGPKLLFPDETIQHAGVVLLNGVPGHAYYQQKNDIQGYGLGAIVNRNYLAVTGACALTSKALFDKVGGYSERYPLNYNDVDYCLKLHQLGYRSVYVADVSLYHYEGVSKEGGRSVSQAELQKFLSDWQATYKDDPYYHINLNKYRPYGL